MVAANYLWNPLNDNIVREFDDGGAVVAEYTTEPEQFGNVVSQRRDGEDDYFHFDGVGSTLAATNQGGTVTDTRAYTAFGEATEQSGTTVCRFQYVGRQGYFVDIETGEYSIRERIYITRVGRWASQDPLVVRWLDVRLSTAQSERSFLTPIPFRDVNWYCYAASNPARLSDPSGLAWWNPIDWLRWLTCAQSAKRVYDCGQFMKAFKALEKACEDEMDSTPKYLEWYGKCPKQISPVVRRDSVRHAELCCILHKAHDDPNIDYEDFEYGFVTCLKALRLPLDVGRIVFPTPTP